MEKFKKVKVVTCIVAFIGVVFFMVNLCPAAPAVQKIVLKYGSYGAPRIGHDEPLIWWAEEVSRRSGVKIEYEFFWAEALAKAPDCFDAIGAGAYDIGWISPIFTPGKTPYLAVANSTPLTTSDLEVICSAHDELSRLGPGKAELEKGNTKYLHAYSTWDYHLIGIKPIKALDDVKGYRCRTFGYLSLPWKELGGVPISMAASEVYSAFQAGLLDGALHQPATFLKGKYYEVAKQYTLMNFGCLPGPFIMNMNKWNSLPPNVQKVMLEVSNEMPKHSQRIADGAERLAMEELKKKGVTFYELPVADRDRFMKLKQKVWAEIGTSIDAKGLPGSKAVELWTGLIKKYEAEKAKRK